MVRNLPAHYQPLRTERKIDAVLTCQPHILEVEGDAAALPFLTATTICLSTFAIYKSISRCISRIVARVKGDNYRFIYAGMNGADYLKIIPTEWVLVGVVFGFSA
jgi:hypothetical protein